MAVSPTLEDVARTAGSPGAAAAPADDGADRPTSSSPAAASPAPSPPPAEPPSPDTPLHPELEAQIQEVFTRTEMGRLVRGQAGRRDTRDSAAGVEGGRSPGGDGEKTDGDGRSGGAGSDGEGGGGGGGEGSEAAESEPVVVHPAAPADRSDGREVRSH